MSNPSGTADLFQNDTTATGRDLEGSEPDRDAVVAAGASSGPGTQADTASSTSAASGAVRAAGSPAAVPVRSAGSSGAGPAIDAAAPATQEPIPGAAQDATPPVDDSAISHVFDQTNGVIEGLEGDSDGTADTAAAGDTVGDPRPTGA